MNITANKPINAIIYVENTYQGGLDSDNLKMVNSIPWTLWIQRWLGSMNLASDRDYELGLRLTSDRQIQELNCQYRLMDKPTDVLAFATAGRRNYYSSRSCRTYVSRGHYHFFRYGPQAGEGTTAFNRNRVSLVS